MRSQKLWILGALALLFVVTPGLHAQLDSNVATVNLNAVLGETLTVSAGPATVNFTLIPNGVANGSAPVSVTTTWALAATRTSVGLYAYFSSANALTDGSGNNIPSSNVGGSVNGGASGPFTNVTPFGANGMTVFAQALGAGTYNSNRADTIDMTIDTTGLGLPSATFTGTLNLQAQAL
jgi:hypothetical protein